MENNTLLFIIIVFFCSIIFVVSAYYEFTLQKCLYQNSQITKNSDSIFESKTILTRDTNLENQFDDSPYTLYKDYFDQASPWIGTDWSHPSDNSTNPY